MIDDQVRDVIQAKDMKDVARRSSSHLFLVFVDSGQLSQSIVSSNGIASTV
jgi:hypothetical protein